MTRKTLISKSNRRHAGLFGKLGRTYVKIRGKQIDRHGT